MARTRKLFAALTRRGPSKGLRGDLAFAGIPGVVYTPESGFNLPGVAFGHDWLTDVGHYHRTLEHLASWGIVAAAPDTERGVAPSVLNLAYDLGTTLDIIAGVRLGPGQIGSVSTRSDREATAPKPWSIERLSRSDATSANFVYTLSIAIIYIIQDLMQSCRTLAMSSRIVRVRAHHHQIGVNVEIAIYLRYFAVSPAGRVLSARASGTTSPSGGAGAWVEASGWR